MSAITINNLTFAYDGSYDNIFENVSLRLDTDWRLGLVGRNGRGKTTLLHLLMGKYNYSGEITANVEFRYFPFEIPDADAAAIEAVRTACPLAEDWEIIREATLLDMDTEALYRPYCTLSNGERTKAMLAALFSGDKLFLLIDEPTNHLDISARKKVREYLRQKSGFILVSHDRELLDGCIDHVISINRASIELQRGNFSSWQENKLRRDEFELAENDRLKKEINRLGEAAKRSSQWSDKVERSKFNNTSSGSKIDRGFVGHKAAKMMSRAKAQENRMLKAAEDKSKLLRNIDDAESLKISALAYAKQTLVEAAGLALYREGRELCSEIGFRIDRGERLALAGKNGCGKSTLLKLIAGENENIEYTGHLEVGGGLKISYVPQDASFLVGSLADYARECGVDESLFKTVLRKLGFERTQLEKDMIEFSEGQKKKALIARSLCERAHLLIWDEPLNFIDVISRVQIEQLLDKYRPTMLFVEHDAAFVKNVADRVILM